MIGTTLGHYQIVAKVGEGGMGEVYRATDTKLGRAVALKVLPPDMARDPERLARFQREARAVAALNHPHIVTIHSVEESHGIHFLTMELIDGQALSEIIPEGGLTFEQILSTGTAIADALASAHDKGIVHRDLKPANVMLTADGRVKVLDFGLAKEMRAADGDATFTRTEMGVVMGTPAYMSPEQIAGRQVDHRTDIFSLGILLYQMASGQRPFEGSTSIELASSILRDTPRPLGEVRFDIPNDLARLIRRCLEKDVRQRVQTTRDVVNELREIARAVPQPGAAAPVRRPLGDSGAVGGDDGFWIAVLPIRYQGSNADVTTFAQGLSEEIVAGLSRFSYLRVIAFGSTVKYANEGGDARTIGKELKARYVLEGSIRQAGTTIRLAMRLIDATTGAHLWAETYDRAFDPNQVFALQDDLIPRIVSTCGDAYGVLAQSISEAVRGRDQDQVTPYEALMRGCGYHLRLSSADHAEARDLLERAVERAPGNADCLAMLSWIYSHEFAHGFNPRPGSLDRALTTARRAVDIAPSNHFAQQALAVALFFRKERAACQAACERALALNPLDASNEAIFLITFMGDWDRGSKLIARAMDLNPHHPAWYRLMLAIHEYLKGNYRGCIDEVMKANAPGVFWANVSLAAAHGQLGDDEAAQASLAALLAQKPDFADTGQELIEKWFDPKSSAHTVDGLTKAGLHFAQQPAPAAPVRRADSSGLRTTAGFWIAVLPFKARGSEPSLEALAEGMTEEIITGLSRFTYLRVIARGALNTKASEAGDVRATAKAVGARYVLEGSIRQVGSNCRVSVQLVDAVSGTHLWAESFDHSYRSDELFALQDQLVPRIVSTVADQHGVLVHSMTALMRNKRDEDLSAHEAALSVFGFHERMSPEEHARVRAILERAVERSPDDSDCWAMLATLYTDEYMFNFNVLPDSLGRAQTAARRAVELSRTSALASQALAQSLFFRKELQACRTVAERTIALNPMDGAISAFMGLLLALSGDWERGTRAAESAIKLNPHFPGWYWLTPLFHAFHKRDYRAAIDCVMRVNIPKYFWVPVSAAAAYGHLGERELARKALQELLAIRPEFATSARAEFEKWFQPDLLDNYLAGLRKAGLDVRETPANEG